MHYQCNVIGDDTLTVKLLINRCLCDSTAGTKVVYLNIKLLLEVALANGLNVECELQIVIRRGNPSDIKSLRSIVNIYESQ